MSPEEFKSFEADFEQAVTERYNLLHMQYADGPPVSNDYVAHLAQMSVLDDLEVLDQETKSPHPRHLTGTLALDKFLEGNDA
jgi:hypothetical protein